MTPPWRKDIELGGLKECVIQRQFRELIQKTDRDNF